VLAVTKKLLTAASFVFMAGAALAQREVHFISGSFAEKSLVDLQLVQVINNNARKIADFQISPEKRDFVFAIPADTGAAYRLQVNIMKQEGRHPKLDKAFTLPLPISADQNYALKITPSALNDAKKSGWALKSGSQSSVAVVTGRVTDLFSRSSGIELNVQSVENGTTVSCGSVQSKPDGSFEIACPVSHEGFYYLTSLRWRTRIYLKPADRVQVEISNKTGQASFQNSSKENHILSQWQQLILPLTSYGYNLFIHVQDSADLNEYIRTYQSLQPAMKAFFASIDKSNPRFNKALKNAVDIDSQLAPINFLLYHPAKRQKGYSPTQKNFDVVPEFYRQFIRPGKFSSASILNIGEAREFMNTYAKLNMALYVSEESKKLLPAEKLKRMMNLFSNDTLRSLFFNDQMEQIEINNLSEFREMFEPFKKYARFSPAKERYNSIYNQFAGDTAFIGKSSYNFSLPDTSGHIVSMKDFKGKVVLIDVWATWCGPCKAQFPFLKQIEEEYAGNKDLVFVGISVDKADAKEKWLAMIRKEGLGGVQLLDDVGKQFANKYEVSAIPRFLLIDKQGRWIEIRCPRPESKEDLKRYLDKALSK
jgi:thiol-disulfide isomerase/thioredoxin